MGLGRVVDLGHRHRHRLDDDLGARRDGDRGRSSPLRVAFFAGNSPAELEAAFGSIEAQLRSCVFIAPSVPDVSGTITVELGTTTLPMDATNGCMWGSLERGEVVLRGEACARSIAYAEQVTVRVTCGTEDGGTTPVAQ